MTPDKAAMVAGMQIALGLGDDITVADIQSDQVDIASDQWTVIDNELRISWNELQAKSIEGTSVLTITLEGIAEEQSIEDIIRLSGQQMTSEIYSESDGQLLASEILLEFSQGVNGEPFLMEQNIPNPFNGITTIRFYQPTSGDVQFRLMDLSGRRIIDVTSPYSKGWHEIKVSTDDLPGSGIYLYEMSNGTELVQKKMITIQ